MRFRIPFLFFIVLLRAVPSFGASLSVIFYDNRFGTLDDATGAYTQVGTLPVTASGGIAALNGLLYLEDFGNNLYSVDSVTGAAHLTGNTGLNLSLAVFGGGQNGLFEIDYASNLYKIDAATGKASLIGSTGLAANNGYYDTSLSTDGISLFYTAGRAGVNDELYSISTITGRATDLGSTGITGIAGSAFVNGTLELYQYGQATNYIYSAVAGSTDFVRGARLTTGIIDGGAIARSLSTSASTESVPEPGTFWQSLALALPIMLALRNSDRNPRRSL
ncbi:MAG: hypothetical protein ABUS51_04025 [Acidobacteriota bacterium]